MIDQLIHLANNVLLGAIAIMTIAWAWAVLMWISGSGHDDPELDDDDIS